MNGSSLNAFPGAEKSNDESNYKMVPLGNGDSIMRSPENITTLFTESKNIFQKIMTDLKKDDYPDVSQDVAVLCANYNEICDLEKQAGSVYWPEVKEIKDMLKEAHKKASNRLANQDQSGQKKATLLSFENNLPETFFEPQHEVNSPPYSPSF